jgi:hypothetical protein
LVPSIRKQESTYYNTKDRDLIQELQKRNQQLIKALEKTQMTLVSCVAELDEALNNRNAQ